MSDRPDQEPPLLRVTRGTPTPEELAALVGAIATRPRPVAETAPGPASAWMDSVRPGAVTAAGLPTRAGGSAWRRSGLPR